MLGALGLLALRRPGGGDAWTSGSLGLAAAAGALLVVHHLCCYEAIHRIPLGSP